LSACKLAVGELEPRGRAFKLRVRLSQLDLVRDRIDDEEQIALVDDVAVLETDLR